LGTDANYGLLIIQTLAHGIENSLPMSGTEIGTEVEYHLIVQVSTAQLIKLLRPGFGVNDDQTIAFVV
jgi:hypothetical protein